MQAAGFVLVGGLSTRMGRDKALLSTGSQPLVMAVARQVLEAAGNVALVGQPERYRELGFDCLADLRSDFGPLSGIEAALKSGLGNLNLIVACDMPSLGGSLLRGLMRRAEETDALCVVARDEAGITHPLCAVYRSACLPVVERALDGRRLRLMDLICELDAEPVDTAGVLWNVNTETEWRAWQQQRTILNPHR